MTLRLRLHSLILVVCSMLILMSSGLAQDSSSTDAIISQLDNGRVSGNIYENKLLGLRLKFPASMKPDPKETVSEDVRDGLELLKTGKLEDQRRIDEMLRSERIVLSLDLAETDTSIGGALNITIKKDETKEPLAPMVTRTIEFFTKSGKQKLHSPAKEIIVGGLKAFVFGLSIPVEGATVYSKIVVFRRNGQLVTISASYADEEAQVVLDKVIDAVEFY